MEPITTIRDTFTVVGMNLPDADRRSYLILQMWVALCPKLHLIPNAIEPHILYGVWHRKAGDTQPSYLVGVRVSNSQRVPEGMTAVRVDGGNFVMLKHVGSMGNVGATYQQIMHWMQDTDTQHREGQTFEVYDTTQPVEDRYAVTICEPII